MSNNLEQFIRQHRSAFDDRKAPEGIWDRIHIREKKTVHLWKWSAIAASALLLVAIGYIVGMRTQTPFRIAGWEEYQETERFYQARINLKMEKIKSLPVSEEVLKDIEVLDEVYAQLRQQLLDDPHADAELLLAAMIKHQQQKLDIMEKILERVDKYQNDEHPNHEM